MNILFAFENTLPSIEADAEVFTSTARHLAPLATRAWLHVPLPRDSDYRAISTLSGPHVIRAYAPLRPAVLRHLCCGITLVFRHEFRAADLVYTRNLFVAWMAILFGQRVVFDHYRPWADQIPPLQRWLHTLMGHPRFLVNICHSDYTRTSYLALDIAPEKLRRVHNGFEPDRYRDALDSAAARAAVGIAHDRPTIVYTGRLNHKKGLDLVLEAARRLPDIAFILVGGSGSGPIETAANTIANVGVVTWQPADRLGQYIRAADVLLIPPSWKPLAEFGSTVLPLKLFLYLASGRPIIAGATPDVMEVLRHDSNAWLCRPDSIEALVAAIRRLTGDTALAERLAAQALADSRDLTWQARARRIHTIIAERLQATPAESGQWGSTQRRNWRARSWLWLQHLIRARSWVLPAAPVTAQAAPDADKT